MTTLYVVTCPNFDESYDSDDSKHSFFRVFSTLEKAEVWIGPATDEFSIKEWELDDLGPVRPMTTFLMTIRADTGLHVSCPGREEPKIDLMPIAFAWESGFTGGDPWRAAFWGRSTISAEHALEIAHQARDKWLESQESSWTFRSSSGEIMTLPAAKK